MKGWQPDEVTAMVCFSADVADVADYEATIARFREQWSRTAAVVPIVAGVHIEPVGYREYLAAVVEQHEARGRQERGRDEAAAARRELDAARADEAYVRRRVREAHAALAGWPRLRAWAWVHLIVAVASGILVGAMAHPTVGVAVAAMLLSWSACAGVASALWSRERRRRERALHAQRECYDAALHRLLQAEAALPLCEVWPQLYGAPAADEG